MKKIILLLFVLMGVESFGQVSPWVWAKSAGGSLYDEGHSIITDAIGNVYVAGYFYSPTITFGSITLTNADNTSTFDDIYLVKYDASGNVLWAKGAGSVASDWAFSISIDSSNNIYLTGSFEDTIIFGATTLISNAHSLDMFIVKYDSNGNAIWAKSAGGTNDDQGRSVSVNASGIYVTGFFYSSSIVFGTDTLTSTLGSEMFVVKYDYSGNVIWAKEAGGYGSVGNSVATDSSGIYITGTFDSSIVFSSNTFTSLGVDDIFIVKYDLNGNVLWSKRAGGGSRDEGMSIVSDAHGNVFVTGYFASTDLAFDTTALFNYGIFPTDDIFIIKYSANGNLLWAKSEGGTNSDIAISVATDAIGNAYITGSFKSYDFHFGNSILGSVGGQDVYAAKYDVNGNELWIVNAGETYDDIGNAIVINTSGIYITGYFQVLDIVFGNTTLYCVGGGDMYIAKLALTTGISEFTNNNSITISPNPFTSQTTITFSEEHASAGSATHTIIITDVLGEVIQQLTTNNNQLTIDMSGVAKGIYFVRIESFDKLRMTDVVNRKIVVQ